MTLAGAKLKAPLLRCILTPYGAVTTQICFTGHSPSPDSKPCAYMTSPSLLVPRWQMYMFVQLVVFHIFLLFADSVSFTGTLTASHHHVLSQLIIFSGDRGVAEVVSETSRLFLVSIKVAY